MNLDELANRLLVACVSAEVQEHQQKYGEVCDFCGAVPTEWVHYTERFRLPFDPPMTGVAGMDVSPEWCACQPCHDMIERGDRAGIRVRADKLIQQHYLFKNDPDHVRTNEVWRMHEAFWEHKVSRSPLKIRGFYKPEGA